MTLNGKTIIVTGGSMGIGRAVALRAAREGARVTVVSRHEQGLAETVRELTAAGGGDHGYFVLDVGRPDDVERIAREAGQKLGTIDGIVNCAGVYGPIGKTEDIDVAAFAETLQTNLVGTFAVCRSFLPLLGKAPRGKIVNFSGGGGASAFPHYSAYAASKAAVVRLTENIGLEYAGRIDANAVAPGFVITRLHRETVAAGERAGSAFLKKTLDEMEKGGASPEKVAALVAFLLSPASDGITGKFVSAVWDSWDDPAFQERLRTDPDFCTLRRIDDRSFFKKEEPA